MRVTVARESIAPILRWTQRALFAFAFLTLGYCGFVFADSWIFERRADLELDRLLRQSQTQAISRQKVAPGGLIGRMAVDRLGVSVAVVEGTDETILHRAAGHIIGTALPGEVGNVGIAAHRDTFFRPLRNIRAGDVVRLITPSGGYSYRVISTKIVNPGEVSVLNSDGSQILTLVTCYPFYYIGSAANRFIVRAERVSDSLRTTRASALQPGTRLPHL